VRSAQTESPSHAYRQLAVFLLLLVAGRWVLDAQNLQLPGHPDSVKLGVIGDNGTGEREQYEVGKQMAAFHTKFPFDTVLMLGDNMYGSQRPQDFVRKFEQPYRALLDSGVQFRASLGNHDEPTNRSYRLFNMGGERYYTFVKGNVRFFALDSNIVDRGQLEWLDTNLRAAREDWKICFFHHPLYSSGGRHGSQVDVRVLFEPLFLKYGVNVVFSGHDHFYERIKPQKGIYYFVSGSAGQLRRGDIRRTNLTDVGFDQDQTFMLVEIAGDELSFQSISRTGASVDAGRILRQSAPAETTRLP
jgi:hypothetical protein